MQNSLLSVLYYWIVTAGALTCMKHLNVGAGGVGATF